MITAVWTGGIGTSSGGMRAGAHVLTMAADPINRGILRSVLEEPLQVPDGHFEVTPEGREGLFVAFVVERWLQSAPEGPIDFAGKEAGLAVAALVEGWSSGLIHALAQRPPQTFRELQRAVDGLGKRALRRTLSAMRRAGQVEVHTSADGDAAAYAPTDWLRAGVAALAAAARVERRDPRADTVPIDALDVEAAFLLSLPLLELPQDLTGGCRLGVSLEDDTWAPIGEPDPSMAGVTARIDRGRVVSCTAGLDLRADTWGAGTASDWLDTVIEPDAKRVRTGGDRRLAALLLNGLHQTLFGVPTR